MLGFLGLTRRNLLVFFKDRQTVSFSLMTSVIVLILYLFFIKGSFVGAIDDAVNQIPGLSLLVSEEDIDVMANLILLTGMLGTALITVPYTCLQTLVRDRENRIDFDVLATPLKRRSVILSYFASAAFSAIVLTAIVLVLGILSLMTQGEIYLSTVDFLKIVGVMAFGSVSSTAFFMIIVLSFHSTAACGAFFGMLSAVSGFLIGAYVPLSSFSEGVQTICNLFPASQITIILRNYLLKGVLYHIDEDIGGMDGGMFAEAIKEIFGFKAHILDNDLDIEQMLMYIAALIVVCLIVQVVVFAKTYKKK